MSKIKAPSVGEAGGKSVLVVESVSLAFGGVAALDDVSLDIAAGEIVAVIGPNGAGKSSLLNVVSGLYRPSRGAIVVAGERFAAVPARRLASLGVARTFQNIALFKGLDVAANIAMGLAHRARSGAVAETFGLPSARREAAEARALTHEIVEFLELGAVARRPVAELAYGLRKRVEFARALIARPRLLLLDEPMAGMNPAEKTEMVRFVRAARERWGAAVALIEHDVGVVMEISDRVAVLDHGRKIADGTPAAVRADQAVIDAYLGASRRDEPVPAELLGAAA